MKTLMQKRTYRAYQYRPVHKQYAYPTDLQWFLMGLTVTAAGLYMVMKSIIDMAPHY